MKKILAKKNNRTGIKNHRSNKNKFRRSYKAYQIMTVSKKPGPSGIIKYDENGKVTGFVKWAGNKKQSEYTTKVAKDAMNENKSIKQSKKELIKNILMKAGYDPTIRYTRKEKKHFTRIVKNNMFTKPKRVTLTTEQIKEKIKADKLAKKSMQAKFDESVRNNPLTPKKGKQMAPSAAELSVKEKPNKRNFQYAIQRKCSDNDMKVYDFATGNFEASTRDEAKNKAAKLAKKYKKDTSFTGVTVKDIEGDNSITYYSRNKLLAA